MANLSKIALSAGAVIVAFSAGTAAYADCATRHFYNKGPVDMILSMGDTAGTCSYNAANTSMCVIPAGKTGEIHYSNGQIYAQIAGQKFAGNNIKILSSDGGKTINNDTYSVNTTTCYINHHGRTNHAVLNDPANGDVAVW